MKLFFLLTLLSLSVQAYWVENNGTGHWVAGDKWSTNGAFGAWFNNYSVGSHPKDSWKTVYVEDVGIPADAYSIDTAGIMIITHGNAQETCDLHIVIKQWDWTYPPLAPLNYIGQAVSTRVGDGVRSPLSTKIPIVDGKFMWGWTASTNGTWPDHCSYGLLLWIQEYKYPVENR